MVKVSAGEPGISLASTFSVNGLRRWRQKEQIDTAVGGGFLDPCQRNIRGGGSLRGIASQILVTQSDGVSARRDGGPA